MIMLRDLKYACRTLLRARGFAALAVATLAIGIGATTAVFSLVDAVLLRPLPFTDPSRLVVLSRVNPTRGLVDAPFSYPLFQQIRDGDRLLSGVAAVAYDSMNLTGVDRPEALAVTRVSASFFDVAGMRPAAGRAFVPRDDQPGAAVAVLGHHLWVERFGRSPSVIGTAIHLGGSAYTVVGALGADLPSPFSETDVWLPRPDEPGALTDRQIQAGAGFLTAIGRLAPGATAAQAGAELSAIAASYTAGHPGNTDALLGATIAVAPFRDSSTRGVRGTLALLAMAVGGVLLIACANVTNLLLVRATGRSREMAVRAALGASRWQVLRQLGAESALLAATGGATGVVLSRGLLTIAAAWLPTVAGGEPIPLDWRVLAFALAVSVASGAASGLAPAVRALRADLVDTLKQGARGVTDGGRAGAVLVVVEVALTLALLVGSALLLQSVVRLLGVPLGFQPDGVVTVQLSRPVGGDAGPRRLDQFFRALIDRIDTIPGVVSAGATLDLPPVSFVMGPYLGDGQPSLDAGARPTAQWAAVTPGYFRTLGIPLLQGRGFDQRDDADRSPVVIVSQSLARRVWPGASPIGRKLLVARQPDWAEVVGVVGDVKNNGLDRDPQPEMYTPYAQRPWPSMRLVVRVASGNPLLVLPSLGAAVAAVDPDQPVAGAQTMSAAIADSVAQARLLASLIGGFAVAALLLAAAGLYGVIAYGAARRTREIAVRVALGASPTAVYWMVVGRGLRLTAIGLAIGCVVAAAAARASASRLFGIGAVDPATYIGASALFLAIASAACVVPARRALRVDPLEALGRE